jgi:hypothetical protein
LRREEDEEDLEEEPGAEPDLEPLLLMAVGGVIWLMPISWVVMKFMSSSLYRAAVELDMGRMWAEVEGEGGEGEEGEGL